MSLSFLTAAGLEEGSEDPSPQAVLFGSQVVTTALVANGHAAYQILSND